MADEITINIRGQVVNGFMKRVFAPGSLKFTQASVGSQWFTWNVGTSEEDLTLVDITTEGWCFMRNVDATNYVTYGPKDTTMKAFGRIEAGEVAAMRLEPGITIRAIADTAAVDLDILILED